MVRKKKKQGKKNRKGMSTDRETGLFYKVLMDHANDAIILADSETGIIIDVNRKAGELTGRSVDSLIGAHQSSLHPKADKKHHTDIFNKHAKEKNAVDEAVIIHSDGRHIPVEISASVIQTDDGAVVAGIFRDITERKKAEKQLKQEVEKAEMYLNIAGSFIVVLDIKNRVQLINRKGCELLGRPRDEIIGKSWITHFIPSNQRKWIRGVLKRIFNEEEGVPEKGISNIISADKQIRVMEWSFQLLKDDENSVSGMLCSGTDITEQKQYEKALEIEKERAEIYLDIAGVMILVLDDKGKVTRINQKGCQILGYPESEILGKSWFANYIPRRFRKQVRSIFSDVMKGEAGLAEYAVNYIITACGEERVIAWHNSVIRDEIGNITGAVSSGEDITDQVEARAALEKARDKYQNLYKQSPGGIIITDLKGTIRSCNEQVLEMLDCGREDFVGKNFRKLGFLNLKEIPRYIKILASIVRGKVPEPFETSFVRGDGSVRYSNVSVKLFTDENGKRAIQAIVVDVTDIKLAEKQALIQRDLGFKLSNTVDLQKGFRICLESALEAANLDGGGIYVKDDDTGDLILVEHKGLSKTFANMVGRYGPDTPQAQLVNAGKPVYTSYAELKKKMKQKGDLFGMKAIAVVPIVFSGKSIGCLNLISFSKNDVPEESRSSLEIITGSIGLSMRRLKSEQALKESEMRYRLMAENVSDVVLTTDSLMRITYTSPSVRRILGYTPEEVFGKPVLDYHIPESREKAKETMALRIKLKSGEQITTPVEYTLLAKNGRHVPVEVIATNIWDEDGSFNGVVGILRDISERKAAENALRNSESTLRNVIDSTPMGMHMYRLEGKKLVFTGANAAADSILGIDHSIFVGKTIEEAFPPLKNTEVPKRYKDTAKNGTPWYTEQIDYQDNEISGAYEVHAFRFAPNRMVASFLDITERKKSHEAIQRSEARLQSIFKSAATGIGVVTNRKLVDVNHRVCEITGYAREELIGKSVQILYPSKKEYEFVGKEKYRLIREKGTGTVETQWKRKDGTIIDVLLSSTPPDLSNPTENVTFTALDITDRKKAMEELERSEERLKILFENAPEAIYLADLKGVFLDGNRAAEELIGYSRDEMIGKSFLDVGLLSIKDIPKAVKELAMNVAGKRVGPTEYTLKRKDGGLTIAEITSYPLIIQGKRVVMGIARDVTNRKRAEEELLRIRAAVDDALDGILVTDLKGKALYINDAFRYLFGFSIMNLEDIDFSAFFTDTKIGKNIFKESLGPVGWEAEVELTSPIGRTFPAYVRGSAIRNEELDDIGILFLISDITLRKHVDDQLKQSLREKETLIKEVHHRVKNNLQIISELLFLQTTYLKDPETLSVFQDSQTRIDTMARLHERVYLSESLTQINISEHIQNTVEDLFETYKVAPSNVRARFDLEDVYLSIDEAVPCGLIVNELVTNVFKYAFTENTKGIITISLKKTDNGRIRLEVDDNGAGFPEEVNIENPESVGLTLVKGLSSQLDGELVIDTVKNKGTRVRIVFGEGTVEGGD